MFSSHRHRSPATPIVRRPKRHRRILELEDLPERIVLSATIYTVDLTTDSGPTSGGSGSGLTGDLRYVINRANANPNKDGSLVQFDPEVFATAQTITLSASLGTLNLTETRSPEAIHGPAAGLTVSGGQAVEVFSVSANVTASLSGLTITGGSAGFGGGVYNAGKMTLTGCTVSGNSAGNSGGGLDNAGTLTLTGCTVSGNSAGNSGGGLDNAGTLTLTGCTVSGNSAGSYGGGLDNVYGPATLVDTIVAGNAAATGPDVDGTAVTSQGHNLIGIVDGSSGWGRSDLTGTAAQPLVAGLAPLGDYGGPTQTMALLPGSAAIGAGSPVTGVTTDQRGLPLHSPDPDIGAFQTNPLVVNTTIDALGSPSRDLSLRQAVNLANALGGAETITFDPKVFATAQTITLSASLGTLALTETSGTEAIDGPAAGVTVSGGKAVEVFSVANNVTASLSGLTITGGSAGHGGGVYNAGTLTLTGCTVSGNSAGDGGGLLNDDGGTLTLTGCTVSGNSAGNSGGGLENAGTLTLTGCTVSDNSAGNSGGGLDNAGTLTLTGCTVSGNSAGGGGGLANGGTLTLTGCTVSGNSAGSYGGGLDNVYGPATLVDTIVAANTSGTSASDIRGDAAGQVTGTNNLIGTGGSGAITGGSGGNIVLTDLSTLGLAPLGDYGGPTQTMALLPGSAAIGAGSPVTGVTTDQRGLPLHSPDPDIGAFQTNPLVVNTTIDAPGSPSGDLSLRQAVNLANALGGAETITFDPTVFAAPQTITLSKSLGTLALTETSGTEAIDGPAAGVTVSGGHSVGVFLVSNNVTATLSGLTISGGSARYGGGLDNSGTLTLTGCTVSGNSATYGLRGGGGLLNDDGGTLTLTGCTVSGNSAGYYGGGLDNAGTLTLTGCTVSGNSAGSGGGGLANIGTLTLTGCTVSGNSAQSGGGLENFAGTLTLTGCTVSGNSAGGGGGLANGGTLTLTGCTISGNSVRTGVGGGLANGGTLTLTGCTVSGNLGQVGGGGLDNDGTLTLTGCTVSGNSASAGGGGGLANGGTLTLTGCTVSGNSALSGGGLVNGRGATLMLTGCTVSGNSAQSDGGGLENYWTLTLTGCTVSGNSALSGGGLVNIVNNSPPATLVDTIVAGNTAGSAPSDIAGYAASSVTGSNNLIGTGGSGGITGGAGGNIVLTDLSTLGLTPLGDYGGPTLTMALLPGSAAIGAGLGRSNINTDQRGAPRATSGAIDIGAFEVQGYTLALVSGSPQTTMISQSFAGPLVVVLTEDYANAPLPGATIEFTAPSSGASATLSAGSAVTGANGQASVTATANATAGTYTASASAGTGSTVPFQLTNQVTHSFSGLIDQMAAYGSTVTFTGTLAAGTQSPPAGEDVAVTVNGVTHDAPLAADGSFSTQFTRTEVVLNASATAYTVTYRYAGDGVFLAVQGSSPLTVNPATLTAAIVGNPTRTYDGTTDASLTSANFSLSGLVGGDGFTVTQTAGTYNSKDVTTAATVTATLAAADFTPGSGALASNYTFPTAASGAGQITPAALTISARSDTRVYNGTTSSSQVPTHGTLFGSDTVTGLAQAFASKDVLGAGGSTLNVSAYTVNDGDGGKDYKVTTRSATGAITPAPLTITAKNGTMPFGGAVPALTASYAGFVGDDTQASLTSPVHLATSATDNSPAGSYPITASGASSADYAISYRDGTMTIAAYFPPAIPQVQSAAGFVTTLYHEVLARGPEPKGLAYWMKRYLRPVPTSSIMRGFVRSKERRTLQKEGRVPSIPLPVAYNDALRAAKQAAKQPMVAPAGPLALRKASHVRVNPSGGLPRVHARPAGAGLV